MVDYRKSLWFHLRLSQLFSQSEFGRDKVIHNGVVPSHFPWEKIQLSKKERKGKTFEEQQAMRKAIWESQNKEVTK